MFSSHLKLWFCVMLNMLRFIIILIRSSWLIIWVFLELNLIAIIPLLNLSSIYYFIIQSLAGIMFLCGRVFITEILLIISMFIKLAIFPFSFWIPSAIKNSSWEGGAILSSLSKLSPLFIIRYFIIINTLGFFLITVLWGAFYGCFQRDVKSILACSSVNHTGWIRSIIILKLKNRFIYLRIYFILVPLLFFLRKNRIYKFWHTLNENKLVIIIILLVLRGLPPFSRMWFKILVFFSFSNTSNLLILLFFISSAFNIFFYFKLILGFLFKNVYLNFKYLLISLFLFCPQYLI